MYSTFSTYFFSTGTGINLLISSLRVSTVMGTNLPIFTMDMVNNRVGVNLGPTQQPRATMDVNGIIYAKSFVTSSDRRLKENIRSLDAPEYIPKAYRYTYTDSDEADIGLMADEIESAFPECVYTRPDGYKAVSYMKLVPVCFTLIQSLSDRIAELESRL